MNKIKQFIRELFCGHDTTPNFYVDKDKRHYYMCKKCGKRLYID